MENLKNRPIKVGVLTISDRCWGGINTDTSGPALCAMSQSKIAAEIVVTKCIPDEIDQISDTIKNWATENPKPDLILTTGGTGLAPRDVTPEATLKVLERRHDGLMELARLRCYEKTAFAFLSRGVAGTIGKTLVINLPGSQRGATENFEALLDILPHAIDTLRGDVKDG